MCRRKKPGTVANQIMRRLPPDLLAIYHRGKREKPLQVEGPEEGGGPGESIRVAPAAGECRSEQGARG